MGKYKLVIIGSGSLGSIIAEYVYRKMSENYEVLGVLVRNREKAMKLANKLNVKVYNNLDEVIEDSPDYIIEAAAPNVLKEMGINILESCINLIPLSVGAFADRDFYECNDWKF